MTRLLRAAPPLFTLLYPALIWAGPAVSPLFLAVSLIVPAIGVMALGRSNAAYPRARIAALLAVAAPPLYSWLGGVLDFQNALPIGSLGAWYVLFGGASIVTLLESPRTTVVARARPSRLAFAHGCSAAVIALFAIAHITNHLAGWWGGGDLHMAVMASLRTIYRSPAAEAVLLAAVAFQAASGLRLLRPHRERAQSWWSTAQVASGAYLAAFFLSHLTAALRARWLRGVDTNWHWLTADSMLTDPWSARLAPYYFAAVIAFGVHAGLGLRYVLRERGWPSSTADAAGLLPPAIATIASALIMAGLFAG